MALFFPHLKVYKNLVLLSKYFLCWWYNGAIVSGLSGLGLSHAQGTALCS